MDAVDQEFECLVPLGVVGVFLGRRLSLAPTYSEGGPRARLSGDLLAQSLENRITT